jgi:Rps23 Pro-64 3,4-dihydroxylase Tpa1-like proline 4-hydroxylase
MALFSQVELLSISHTCTEKIVRSKLGIEYFEEPYKHIVIDNFLDQKMADFCLSSFPDLDQPCWERANDADIEVKYRTNWKSEFDIPENIVDAVRILNSADMLHAMAARLSIPKLMPDPYFSGGGLNVSTRGGLLDVHVDGNYHDASGLNRRLNAILYLNPGWQPYWGGEFGLYDKTGKDCLKLVPPLFNRLVIFDSHDFSFHGLPEPIAFPHEQTRKSIILYYYTKAPRPDQQIAVAEPHSALWVKRGLADKRGNKTRAFD